MRVIKCLSYKSWGADPKVLIYTYIYYDLVRSRLDYGGFLIQIFSIEITSKLEKVQIRALGQIMGHINSTPRNVILGKSKVPPLNIRNLYS